MQSKLPTTSPTLVRSTTEKIFQQKRRQGVKLWERMGFACIVWSFQGFRPVQLFTSLAQERFTRSNMISQMCGASCQASYWLLERLLISRIWCMVWRNFCEKASIIQSLRGIIRPWYY